MILNVLHILSLELNGGNKKNWPGELGHSKFDEVIEANAIDDMKNIEEPIARIFLLKGKPVDDMYKANPTFKRRLDLAFVSRGG